MNVDKEEKNLVVAITPAMYDALRVTSEAAELLRAAYVHTFGLSGLDGIMDVPQKRLMVAAVRFAAVRFAALYHSLLDGVPRGKGLR